MSLVDAISHTEVRNILLKHGIKYRQSKITLGYSLDPEYHLKKKRIEELRYSNLSSDSDPALRGLERTDSSKNIWRYILVLYTVSVSKAQKTKGILNVFGIYDYTNDQMWTHGYKKENRKTVFRFYQKNGCHVQEIGTAIIGGITSNLLNALLILMFHLSRLSDLNVLGYTRRQF